MCKLKKTDFYYGAFLSMLLNNGNTTTSLFDDVENSSRKIYRFSTEHSEQDNIVMLKYVNAYQAKKFLRWTFNVTDDEISQLHRLNEEYGNVKLTLLCLSDNADDCELVVVPYEDMLKYAGLDVGTKSTSISIKRYIGQEGLAIYGSGISEDKANKISRDTISSL